MALNTTSTAFSAFTKSDCTAIGIIDKRYGYQPSNTGGYGSPNDALGDFISSYISIAKRNEDGTYETAVQVDSTATLPNVVNDIFYLTGEDYSGVVGSTISDGIYKLIYHIEKGDGSSVEAEKIIAVTCSIDCCYKKLMDKARCANGCNVDKNTTEMSVLMRALEAAKDCGDVITIQELINILTRKCAQCGCGCQ